MPPPQQVPSHQVGAVVEGAGRRWRQRNHPRHRNACTPVVEVALHTKRVLVRHFPIRPEAFSENVPTIHGVVAGGLGKGITIKILGKEAVVASVTEFSAIADGPEAAFLVAASRAQQGALRIFGRLGDDVDDAIHGVRAPQRRPRAADHFDPLDVFQQRVLHIPVHAGE